MKILILSPRTKTIANFRGDLIQEMVARHHEVVAVGPQTGYEEQISSLGARFRLLPMIKDSVSIRHDIRYMRELNRLFSDERPDLVFSYTIKPVIYGSIVAKRCGVDLVYPMVTGLGYIFTTQSPKARLLRVFVSRMYKEAFKRAHTVIFQNTDDMEEMVARNIVARDRCAVVNGSGVNTERFPVVPLPKRFSFLMVSRIMHNKGVLEYLNAARIVKRKYPEVEFMLVGAIESMADTLHHQDIECYIKEGSVKYADEQTDVRPYYANCSVYVLPSYREGTPRTVLEAMATGRPVITTDVPGCRQTVIDGETGFLVPARDADALALKMMWFVENQHEVERMGSASHQLCERRFDVVSVNLDMLRIMGLD